MTRPLSKRRLAFGLLLALLGLIVLLPTALVMVAATTETGLQIVAQRLKKVGRVQIDARGIEGSLTGGFRIASLTIDHPRVHLEFGDVEGRAAVLPLMWQTIELPRVQARTALIQVHPAPPPRPGTPRWRMRFLPGALTVRAEELGIGHGTLVVPSGRRFEASALDAAGVVRSREIRVLRGAMELPNLRVQTSGRLLAGRPLAMNGTARLNIHAEGQPDWFINGEFDGDLETLPITATISAPFRADVQGRAIDLTRGWSFAGAAVVEDFDIRAWGGGGALGPIRGELSVSADREGYRGRGRVEPAGLEAGPFDLDAWVRYGDRRVELRRVLIDHPGSRAHAELSGEVLVERDGPRLGLGGTWRDFRWPLPAEDPSARSAKGSFRLDGVRPWRLVASGELTPAQLDPMTASIQGRLAGDRLTVEAGVLRAYGGVARLRGEARWSPERTWNLRGRMSGLDLGFVRKDLNGRIDFALRGAARGFGDDAAIDLEFDDIGGTVRNLPVRGAGAVARRGAGDARSWRFDDVDLRVGGSRLTLAGTTAAPRDLRFDVVSDDLGLVWPQWTGSLQARGRLADAGGAPSLRLQLDATNLQRGDDLLRRLDADLDVQLVDGGRMRGTAHARDLTWAGRSIEELHLDLDGDTGASVLGLNLRADPVTVAMRARGSYARNRWRGVVDSFDISDGDSLVLRLTEFAPLTIDADGAELARACLEGQESRLCMEGRRRGETWRTAVHGERLPLRAVTAGLTRDTTYEGGIDFDLTASAAAGAGPDVRLDASLASAALRHRFPDGRVQHAALGTGRVAAELQGMDFAMDVGLNAGEAGRLAGRIAGQRQGASWRDWPARGRVELVTDALGLIDLFVSDIDRAAGRLAATLDVGGTLGAPRLLGELHVTDGELDVYQVNLALRDIVLDARLEDRALSIDGRLRAGEGSARFDGRVAWNGGVPQGRLAIAGENLRLVDVPDARILASPDLALAIDGRRIEVTGEVRLPEAHLDPADITGAVLPSGDEVLVDAPPPDPERQFQVTSRLRLTLGDDVTIDTYGLSGRLTGTIETRVDETEVTRASGELNVAEGRYAAFGRNLDIERGRLLFNNGPVADPGIDLRAQKVYPDIVAGVNVRGTLRAPRMTFFSEPAIPQSQIVSLILAGGSLESVQGANGRGGARNDLLAQGGAILAQQFGSRVGIEDVGIEQDLSNETSLVLGKYLSPRLYVSYGISLAEAINTVKLRYTIDDHWTIKTESGRESSADIVFTLQR